MASIWRERERERERERATSFYQLSCNKRVERVFNDVNISTTTMWTKARCLSGFNGRDESPNSSLLSRGTRFDCVLAALPVNKSTIDI